MKKYYRYTIGKRYAEEEILKEAGITVRGKEGPSLGVFVQKKLFGSPAKEFTGILNFSSFELKKDFIAKDAPEDFQKRGDWEEKKVKELIKKTNPIVRKFISDLKKVLKTVK